MSSTKHYAFSHLSVSACLASHKNHLNLSKWTPARTADQTGNKRDFKHSLNHVKIMKLYVDTCKKEAFLQCSLMLYRDRTALRSTPLRVYKHIKILTTLYFWKIKLHTTIINKYPDMSRVTHIIQALPQYPTLHIQCSIYSKPPLS